MWITRQSCDQIRDVYTPLTLADNLAVFELHPNYQWSRSLRRVWGCAACTTVKLTKAHSHSPGEANWNTYKTVRRTTIIGRGSAPDLSEKIRGHPRPSSWWFFGRGTKPLPKKLGRGLVPAIGPLGLRPWHFRRRYLTPINLINQSINQAVYWCMAAVSWINTMNTIIRHLK